MLLAGETTVRGMLIVAGTIITEPRQREPFLTAVQDMISETLKEAGCHEYAFTPDPNDDDRLLLYELWESQSALDSHFASAHMAAWQTTRRGLAVRSTSIKKYNISSVENLT